MYFITCVLGLVFDVYHYFTMKNSSFSIESLQVEFNKSVFVFVFVCRDVYIDLSQPLVINLQLFKQKNNICLF